MTVKFNKSVSLANMSLTPLIDVVFLLLIFFLISTRFDDEERLLDILLPQASEAVPLIAAPQELIVNINRQGAFYVHGKEYGLSGLEMVLSEAWGANPTGASVIIRGDRACPFGQVVAVANLCKKLGIQYSTMTQDE
ncbi:MAG: biopolymer transporter ExbD [Planctomycetia bacterium]|nr:biopolymer transporter ExbD [Planctomycetia bacterium]